ncbi:sensor histidine kinase [Xanthovirga aplysinae]|uniref:sensor histidine kinase n=1 Tax=Xanthovirga aplysinae TaxID=2529853 RepID=UPI0012BC5331|nr:HAMP domain-containing sensor histidine kinase [Xanthovirga aplysinae]MTI32158.1 HAMP domain-containing histidine kinase [Xanthovirga aplysinae]
MKNSLFIRLSFIFVIILLLIGLAYALITTITAKKYFEETTQRLHAGVAEHMLLEVEPFVDGKVNEEALGKIMHSMMAVNPSLEVYLLDPHGKILSYVVLDKKVKLNSVSLEPVLSFIENKGNKLILGDDPRHPKGSTIFSATAVYDQSKLMGYVYMVLVSEKFESITSTLIGSYALTLGAQLLFISLIAAFIIGLSLIWLLTKNLRGIVHIFRRFEEGDMKARIPEAYAKGELSVLSRTFNRMADKILQNIEELKNVDQLRRELIANVSHDLRNPLAVIHGYIETIIIKDETLSAEDRKKYLQIILKGSERLKKLVADLFELSKLETKQIVLNKEPFLINELLLDSSRGFELLAEQKGITLKKDISSTIPPVKADIALIERVIQNLLENAIKYTPEEGHISLRVIKKKEEVEVSIENSGEGIPKQDIPYIFDRYYKTNQEKDQTEGTGLGLAISKKILEIHKASISVASSTKGPTVFCFSLPCYN